MHFDGQPQASAHELRGRDCPARHPFLECLYHLIHGAERLGTDTDNVDGGGGVNNNNCNDDDEYDEYDDDDDNITTTNNNKHLHARACKGRSWACGGRGTTWR